MDGITITPLASSSSGNCYHLTDGRTELLLEAGIRLQKIRQRLGFGLSRLAGCLVSHEHQDHAKAACELMRAGVDVYATRGTLAAIGASGHRAKPIRAKEPVEIGTWRVLPFDVVHDAAEPVGFLLASQTGKVVYLTDTAYCPYRFEGVTHFLVECNYSIRLLNENVRRGIVPEMVKSRIIQSHMALETVVDFLRSCDLSQAREIWLLHLSDNNADEAYFKRRIQEVTGKAVYIASA